MHPHTILLKAQQVRKASNTRGCSGAQHGPGLCLPRAFSYWASTPAMLSHVQLFAMLCTVAHQTPLSVGFSRQEYRSELPFPPPWDLPDPGIKTTSPTSPGLAGGFFTTSGTWEARYGLCRHQRKKILINHNADQFQTYLTKADSQCKIVVFLYIAKRLN